MSFKSILHTIGVDFAKFAGIADNTVFPIAQTILSFVPIPGATAILNMVHSVIDTAETMNTTAQAGAAKQETTAQILINELPNIQELITEFGSGFTFDQGLLTNLINASVAERNAITAFYGSLKKAPTPAPAAKAA